jgi:hypothetical protein
MKLLHLLCAFALFQSVALGIQIIPPDPNRSYNDNDNDNNNTHNSNSDTHNSNASLPMLKSSYDYIIIGAGIGGLVVANRLTEDPSGTYSLTITICINSILPCFLPFYAKPTNGNNTDTVHGVFSLSPTRRIRRPVRPSPHPMVFPIHYPRILSFPSSIFFLTNVPTTP